LEEVLLEYDYFDLHSNIITFMSKLVEGVEQFHDKGYIFNNINLKSIYVDVENMDPYYLSVDYLTKENQESTIRNTKNYISPNQMGSWAKRRKYVPLKSDDVYALGVVYYSLITKQIPYDLNEKDYSNLKETEIRFNDKFYELDISIIQNSMVVEEYRMDIGTFRQSLFQFRVNMCQNKCHVNYSWAIKDRPEEILDVLKQRKYGRFLEDPKEKEEHNKMEKVESFSLVETLAWVLLLVVLFGSFYVIFRLCCLERKTENTRQFGTNFNARDILE
jgi:serine/threonine protein kinase